MYIFGVFCSRFLIPFKQYTCLATCPEIRPHYKDDIDKVRAVIKKILDEHPDVLKDPKPVIAVSELADSSVNFIVRPWVNSADYWAVYWDLTENVKLTFDAEGISIPFPQQDVHMHQAA